MTGDATADLIALNQWVSAFYSATVVQSGLLDPSYQADAGTFDPNNLPDPTDSSIAKAQDTANRAYAKTPLLDFSFTLSDTDNEVNVTFNEELATADYIPVVTPSTYTGTPASGAFILVSHDAATDGLILTFSAAPGLGDTVTYDVILFPRA